MISNIIGIVEDARGVDGARIRVLSFKTDRRTIRDYLQIKNQFPPQGCVYSPHFFKDHNIDAESVFEFRVIQNPHPIANGDVFLLDNRKEPKLAGIPVINVPGSILSDEHSINQSILKKVIGSNASTLYISDAGFIYGPFKQVNGEVVPKIGMDVNRYDVTQIKPLNIADQTFLLEEPAGPYVKVDCMTPSQLGEWIKSILRNKAAQFDFNSLKKMIESQDLKELDKVRLNRASTYFDQIKLNVSDLQEIAKSSENFSLKYSLAIERAQEELKESLIAPILHEKKGLEDGIKTLTANIGKLKKEEASLQQKYTDINKLCVFITQEKDRLINELKVFSELGTSTQSSTTFSSYNEQVFRAGDSTYESLTDFIVTLNKSFSQSEDTLPLLGSMIYQLKDFRLLLSQHITSILQIAKHSNNCKVIIQQVEPTWLRFETCFQNGLCQIWKSALENNDLLHFFVLQDINIASIECYARPLIDVIEKVRTTIPGVDSDWPRNLWIFGIPISTDDGYNFGLPLQKRTFRAWGALPKTPLEESSDIGKNYKKLNVEMLLNHPNIPTTSINEYF